MAYYYTITAPDTFLSSSFVPPFTRRRPKKAVLYSHNTFSILISYSLYNKPTSRNFMNSTTRFIAKESIEENRASHSLWNVLLDEPLRSKAAAASLWVAEHLCDPAYVQQIALLAKVQRASTHL